MLPTDQKVASGGASSFTIAAATSLNGDVAVLFISMFSASSHAVTSVTDANGNVFTRRSTAARLTANSCTTEVWTSPITTPLGIITVQLPASNSFAAHLSIWRGLASAVPDAEGHNATAPLTASASITVTASGATTHANELVVAAVMAKAGNSASNSFTDDATYTTLTAVTPTGTLALHPGYKTLSATGTPAMTGQDAVTGGFTVQEMTGNLVTFQLAGTTYSKTGGAYSNLDGGGPVSRAIAKAGGAFSDLDGGGSTGRTIAKAGGAYSDLSGGGTRSRTVAKAGGAYSNFDGGGSVSEIQPPTIPDVFCSTRTLTSITVGWTSSAQSYPIAYYELQIDTGGIIGPLLPATYTDAGVTSASCHSYSVRAVDTMGNASGWSGGIVCCSLFPSPESIAGLGCGVYDLYVMTRGGGTIVANLPFTSLTWTRELDDVSHADVTIAGLAGGSLDDCCKLLSGIKPWKHELALYRNGERVWAGPLLLPVYKMDGATLAAQDLAVWLRRRILHDDHHFVQADIADIFNAYVLDAMSVDNSPGLVCAATPTLILATRTVLHSQHRQVWSAIKELDRTGIDWSVVDRVMRVGGTSILPPSIGLLLDDHFGVQPEVTLDGLSQATDVYVRGAGGGAKGDKVFGHVFDAAARAEFGILELAPRERLIEDDVSAVVSADTRLQLLRSTPAFISEARLSPTAPVQVNQLIPGAIVDIRLTDTCWPVAGKYRVGGVTCTVNSSGEVIDLALQPVGTAEEPE